MTKYTLNFVRQSINKTQQRNGWNVSSFHFLDYVLQMSIDLIKENGFTLKKAKSRQYPAKTMTDADYTNDLSFFANPLG